jgi:ABC-type uncharacterized transport system substrate-binding protein
MRRREFFTLLGIVAAWPLAARAQKAVTQATIGLLGSSTAAAQSQLTAAFVQRLRELGWIEGRNVTIEYRWAEGHTDRLAGLADELVRLRVDVILTHNTPPTLAAKRATSVIPIVFATAGDAVGTGIVASLARPGGNVTGLSSLQPDTAGKRIELLRELIPGLRRLAVLTDVGNPFADRDVSEVRRTARTMDLEVETFEILQAKDIDHAFEAFQGRVQAVYVPSVPLLFANGVRINSMALAARLPTMHGVRELVETGGWCRTVRTGRTCGVARPTSSTKFCAVQDQPTFRSSSRPNSNWSSTSRPRKPSTSRCLRRFAIASTR